MMDYIDDYTDTRIVRDTFFIFKSLDQRMIDLSGSRIFSLSDSLNLFQAFIFRYLVSLGLFVFLACVMQFSKNEF